MRTYYQIKSRNDASEPFRVRANSYDHAAQIAARRLVHRRACAERVTGDPGKSGYYQAYLPLKGGGARSDGAHFHVCEA